MKKNFDFERIGERYDPEHDVNTSSGSPRVTWAEKALYDAVKVLALRVSKLETQFTPEAKSNENGMDAQALAVEKTQVLNLDDAIRVVAKSGKNHESGPNWYVEWEGLSIGATFNAGTNNATVRIISNDIATNHLMLYSADEYGRHIDTFRYGPWVDQVIFRAGTIRAENKAQHILNQIAKAKDEAAKFAEVDY